MSNVHAEFDRLVEAGEVVRTKTLTEDELTWTFVNTFRDMEALSHFATAQSLWFDYEFFKHGRGQKEFSTSSSITSAFTESVSFAFPIEKDPLIVELYRVVRQQPRVSNISVTSNSVSAVYTFNNGADYDQSKSIFSSMVGPIIGKLVANGVVRTRTYAFVSNV